MYQIGYFVVVILISFCAPGLPEALAGSPPSPAGNALLLSDLHFDPLADPSLVKRLIDAGRQQPAQRFEHYELVTDRDGRPVELGRVDDRRI